MHARVKLSFVRRPPKVAHAFGAPGAGPRSPRQEQCRRSVSGESSRPSRFRVERNRRFETAPNRPFGTVRGGGLANWKLFHLLDASGCWRSCCCCCCCCCYRRCSSRRRIRPVAEPVHSLRAALPESPARPQHRPKDLQCYCSCCCCCCGNRRSPRRSSGYPRLRPSERSRQWARLRPENVALPALCEVVVPNIGMASSPCGLLQATTQWSSLAWSDPISLLRRLADCRSLMLISLLCAEVDFI